MTDRILSLVGRRVTIRVSDPWEFGTEVGTQPISAVVERVHTAQTASSTGITRNEELLVRVMKPFAYEKRKCEFFTASPRHENGTFADLVNGGSVASNFVRKLSLDEQGDANIGLIGDVRLG